MERDLFAQLIRELATNNNRIAVPGLGSFIVESEPAQFVNGGKILMPPTKKMFFKRSETWNDELLVNKYALLKGVTEEVSMRDILNFVAEIIEELDSQKSFFLPSLGTIKITNQGTIFFVEDKDYNIAISSYGLEPLSIKDVMQNVKGRLVGQNKNKTKNKNKAKKDNIKQGKGFRIFKSILLFVLIISILSLILCIIVFFREEIGNFIQTILYTEEELKFLREG